jgi:type IV pilus assembly protein PilB
VKQAALHVNRHTPLGEILLTQGAVNATDLERALTYKREQGVKLGQALLALDLVTEAMLAEALKRQGKLHCIHLTQGIVDPEVAQELGEERSRKLNAIAINRIAGVITVALEDPTDVYGVDEIALHLKTQVLAVHAEPQRIRECIETTFRKEEDNSDALDAIVGSANMGSDVKLDVPADGEDGTAAEVLDQPVINLIRRVLEEAYEARASDIHLEARRDAFVIRFRVDGALYQRLSLERVWARPCVARLKVLANLDIAQRRLPQDGRVQAEIKGARVDLRVATSPTLFGEGAVIRILDGGRELRGLESLDLDASQLAGLEKMIECSEGMVLATGPTGSGKTTTLYALLKELNRPDTKIITLEDPVENYLDGAAQISTNVKIGLDFARGLRSILRQDPDVVLVGEIRDNETAEIAVQASLTGHLVLSTVHTVGTAETVTRLTDMGIERFLLGDTLRGIISQRLVRRICDQCKRPVSQAAEILERFGIPEHDFTIFFEGKGCDECRGTGYRGRLGLYEIMLMTPQLCSIVREKGTTEELYAAAIQAGLVTLRDDGIRKARAGQTTLSEVLSVTSRA